MKPSDFLQDIGRPMAYYPKLRKVTGSTTATIMLCNLIYWRGKESGPDGWIYKTAEEIEDETGLSYREQQSARKQLVKQNLVEETYHRLDHKMYFRVNLQVLDITWSHCFSRNDDLSFRETTDRQFDETTDAQFGKRQIVSSYIKEASTTTSSTASTTTKNDVSVGTTDAEVVRQSWNKLASECGLTPCRTISTGRRTHLNKRLKESDWIDSWHQAMDHLKTIKWIRGSSTNGWKANFDWFIRPDTVAKILEGAHDDRETGKPKTFDEKRDLYQAPEGYDGPFA